MSKLIIVAAPSGAGKTTIVNHLLKTFDSLSFSVSAATRRKRDYEADGVNYYFISPEQFKEKIREGAFVEWEEVYDNQYYGTLRSEIERLWKAGKNIIFDIDVKGALNIKKQFPEESLTIFVKPPSEEILINRLKNRRTETEKSLRKRIARVKEELKYEDKFDKVVLNDKLQDAFADAEKIVADFLHEQPKKKTDE